MKDGETQQPSILVQYPGPAERNDEQDILIFLRPEYNGVLLESILFRAVENNCCYKNGFYLVYMANLPGDFICKRKVIETYYSVQLQFATFGTALFTDYICEQFELFFNCKLQDAQIVGAFDALQILNMTPNELFAVWVPQRDILKISGQSIKRVRRSNGESLYVVNYDVPALLHRNNKGTNIAVMIFRTRMGYAHFNEILMSVCAILQKHKLIGKNRPVGRLFHASRGPFEEVRDATGYLYHSNGDAVSTEELSFACYMEKHGIAPSELQEIINHPIGMFMENGGLQEHNIINFCRGDRYEQSLEKIQHFHSSYLLYPLLPESMSTELPPQS